MKMSDWEIGFAEDLASVAAIADSDVKETIGRIARVWQPMLRNRLLELMTVVGAELSETAAMPGDVELRVTGDDVSFAVIHHESEPQSADFASTRATSDGEPADADARISLRINEALKERIAAAATADGMSVNTWIARALDREVSRPQTTRHHPATTSRNQLRGYGRS